MCRQGFKRTINNGKLMSSVLEFFTFEILNTYNTYIVLLDFQIFYLPLEFINFNLIVTKEVQEIIKNAIQNYIEQNSITGTFCNSLAPLDILVKNLCAPLLCVFF